MLKCKTFFRILSHVVRYPQPSKDSVRSHCLSSLKSFSICNHHVIKSVLSQSQRNACYSVLCPNIRGFTTIPRNAENDNDRVRRRNSYPSITLQRVVLPPDIQMLGLIHGGILLKWIEEAGDIVATRFCNRFASGDDLHEKATDEHEAAIAVLARVESVDFMHQMKLGTVVELHAQVTFTSNHSLQVIVDVYSSNIKKRELQKHANRSVLWYVPVSVSVEGKIMPVPRLTKVDPELHEQARLSYLSRVENMSRSSRTQRAELGWANPTYRQGMSSSYIIQPQHCFVKFCKGGNILKWMDELTGVLAISYYRHPCVTASIDAANFYKKIPLGAYITISARPVFASAKTLDVEAVAFIEHLDGERVEFERVADAFYTFAVMGSESPNAQKLISPLELVTEEEQRLFEVRLQRYKTRKAARTLRPSE